MQHVVAQYAARQLWPRSYQHLVTLILKMQRGSLTYAIFKAQLINLGKWAFLHAVNNLKVTENHYAN